MGFTSRAAAIEPRARVRSAPAPNDAPRRMPPSPPRTAAARRRTGSAGCASVCAPQRSRPSRRLREPETPSSPDRDQPASQSTNSGWTCPWSASFRWVDDNDHLGTQMPLGAVHPHHSRPRDARGSDLSAAGLSRRTAFLRHDPRLEPTKSAEPSKQHGFAQFYFTHTFPPLGPGPHQQ